MANWFLNIGIYLISFGLIFLAGLALTYWGLWGNRSKGRPRCPKCWYDMRGSLPNVVCPECGHNALVERRLYKDRRRWWAIVLGVILILPSGYSLSVMYGWHREQRAIKVIRATTRNPARLTNVKVTVPNNAQVRVERFGFFRRFKYLPRQLATFGDRASYVDLDFTATTDDDLKQLEQLQHVKNLSLGGTPLTDAGLFHLRNMTELYELNLRDTQIKGNGLAHLANASKLNSLWLGRTKVTDSGISHLPELPQLKVLELSNTKVTDLGLIYLERASHLEYLDLSGTHVTNMWPNHVKGLPQLSRLYLNGTGVTDEGLLHLKELPALNELILFNTKVTHEGIAGLKRSLNLTVFGP